MKYKRHIFLMYCGRNADGNEYRKWDAEETKAATVYSNDQAAETFFPGFLLLGIKSGLGGSLINGFGNPGYKKDWLRWLDDIFLPGFNLDAIAANIEKYKLPPVDIWISIPYPDMEQKDFGQVYRQSLNFAHNKDREIAVKWWLNRFISKWEEAVKNRGKDRFLKLRGFYWARESMTLKDRLVLPNIISYCRSLGFGTIWIPYYTVTPFLNLQNPGFDITIIQPGYLQNQRVGWKRLSAAYNRANKHSAGIEIELDTAALYQNSAGFNNALDYLNRGLPQFEGYMFDMYIAYYTGYKTIVALQQNKNPLYDYLFSFVRGSLQKVDYPGIRY